jgi:hypothetical protein
MQVLSPVNVNSISHNSATLYFRIGTAQGSAATATVTFGLQPVS